MPVSVFLRIESKSCPFSESKIRRAAIQILKVLGKQKVSISILLAGDSAIRKLNHRYLGHDRATDVIAFPGKPPFLGDIVISLPTTKRQAKEYGNDFFYELAFYLCHGILHLMGWDDSTVKSRKKMWEKQSLLLKKIGVRNSKIKDQKSK